MPRQEKVGQVDDVRRKLLKSSMIAGGFFAAGSLPYAKPAVRSFFGTRSAWAQASTFATQFTGSLPDLGSPLGAALGTGQDAWTFDTTQPNTTLTINAMVTGGGPATPEIGLFAPGVPTTGINLLNGIAGGYVAPLPVVVVAAAVGTYTIAIEDSLIDALQVSFSYQINITAGAPIVPGPSPTDRRPCRTHGRVARGPAHRGLAALPDLRSGLAPRLRGRTTGAARG